MLHILDFRGGGGLLEFGWIHSSLCLRTVLCAIGGGTSPNHDPSIHPMHSSWTGVVFTNHDALCSPNSPLLILACNQCSNPIGWQDWFPKCARLLEIVLLPNSHAEICGEDAGEAIFVQVSLNSWTVYHNSRVCEIFLEVFCTQISVPTSCFSSDPMSTFTVPVPLTFLYYMMNEGNGYLKTLCYLAISAVQLLTGALRCFVVGTR